MKFKLKLKESFNKRFDDPMYYVPKNDKDFLDAFEEIAQNIPSGSLDMAVTKMSSEMYQMMKSNPKLLKKAKDILKDYHGVVTEADSGYGDLGVIPNATNPKIKLKKEKSPEDCNKKKTKFKLKKNEVMGDLDLKDKKLAKKIAKAKSKVHCVGDMTPSRVPTSGKTIKFKCTMKDKQKARKMSKIRKKFNKTAAGKKSIKIAQKTKNFRNK